MVIQTDKHYYTPEEYLELEAKAEYKSEYRDGEIIPIPGGTTNHNTILVNFCRKFPVRINNEIYRTYISDIKLWINNYRLYTYPDLMVVRGKPIYEGKNPTNIINPFLIVEVLSKSTKDYDRKEKFKYYRSIPDFQEYIMIDQYSFNVEQFFQLNNGQWIFQEYDGEDAILTLKSVDLEILLRDIYELVDFAEKQEE
ncbi:MAG TPA: Uma2 family endonuclease [Nostocaceae cyanobacterium]|nr:Uma2 family endonuclease [Nostocaceae cyanobacterium]